MTLRRVAVVKTEVRRAMTLRRVAVRELTLTRQQALRSLRKPRKEAMSQMKERWRMMSLKLSIPRLSRGAKVRGRKELLRLEVKVVGLIGLPLGREPPLDHQPLLGMTCPLSFLETTHLQGLGGRARWRLLTQELCLLPIILLHL